ncbi:hypothetical protein HYX58_04795 [Candidatus Dependentiae bacterium]|nr:hypothetical protein [Candidatus Dependentiae bacterium]
MIKQTALVFLFLACTHSIYAIETMYDAIQKGQIDKIRSVLKDKYHFDPVNKFFLCDRILAENERTVVSMIRDLKNSNEAIENAIYDKENGIGTGLQSVATGILFTVITYGALTLPIGMTKFNDKISEEARGFRHVLFGIGAIATAVGGLGIIHGAQLIKNAGPADNLKIAQNEIAENSKIFLNQFTNYCDEHRIKLPREVQKELWEFEDFLKKD